MCYKCELCEATSEPRQKRLVHRIMRTKQGRKEIAVEMPVCSTCHHLLTKQELTLVEVKRQRNLKNVVTPTVVVVVEAPVVELQKKSTKLIARMRKK